MKRILGIAVTVCVLTLVSTSDSVAQQATHQENHATRSRQRPVFNWFQHRGHRPHYYSAVQANKAKAAQVYGPYGSFPKFYGGFHANHYNNLGIPNGDLGFRGNGIYWAPWN